MKVENDAAYIWKAQHYALVREYNFKKVPPPFTVFYNFYAFVYLLFHLYSELKRQQARPKQNRWSIWKLIYLYFVDDRVPGFCKEKKTFFQQ